MRKINFEVQFQAFIFLIFGGILFGMYFIIMTDVLLVLPYFFLKGEHTVLSILYISYTYVAPICSSGSPLVCLYLALFFYPTCKEGGMLKTVSFGDRCADTWNSWCAPKTNYGGPWPPAWLCIRTGQGESVIVSGHRWVQMRGPPLRRSDTSRYEFTPSQGWMYRQTMKFHIQERFVFDVLFTLNSNEEQRGSH